MLARLRVSDPTRCSRREYRASGLVVQVAVVFSPSYFRLRVFASVLKQ